jgi:hypothetical protein
MTRAYGTGFIFAEKDGWAYVVTNHHVANDDLVYFGAKKFIEVNEIVENINDMNRKDDIALEFIGSSAKRDIAMLRVRKDALESANATFKKSYDVYRGPIGDSSTLQKGDKIVVEGYPLALLKATAEGVVSSPEYDDEHADYGWKHKDVVIDTAINPGNSGSPAFRRNPDGSLEWVGQVHAGYRAEGLKLFVQINEFKDEITRLSMTGDAEPKFESTQKDLETITQFIATSNETERLFNALGDPVQASLRLGGKGLELVQTIYTGNFPLDQQTRLELHDLAAPGKIKADLKKLEGLGTLDLVVVQDKHYGRKELDVAMLPNDLKVMSQQVYTVLSKVFARTADYKKYIGKDLSKEEQAEADKLLKDIRRFEHDYGQIYRIFQQNLTVYLEQERLKK